MDHEQVARDWVNEWAPYGTTDIAKESMVESLTALLRMTEGHYDE